MSKYSKKSTKSEKRPDAVTLTNAACLFTIIIITSAVVRTYSNHFVVDVSPINCKLQANY